MDTFKSIINNITNNNSNNSNNNNISNISNNLSTSTIMNSSSVFSTTFSSIFSNGNSNISEDNSGVIDSDNSSSDVSCSSDSECLGGSGDSGDSGDSLNMGSVLISLISNVLNKPVPINNYDDEFALKKQKLLNFEDHFYSLGNFDELQVFEYFRDFIKDTQYDITGGCLLLQIMERYPNFLSYLFKDDDKKIQVEKINKLFIEIFDKALEFSIHDFKKTNYSNSVHTRTLIIYPVLYRIILTNPNIKLLTRESIIAILNLLVEILKKLPITNLNYYFVFTMVELKKYLKDDELFIEQYGQDMVNLFFTKCATDDDYIKKTLFLITTGSQAANSYTIPFKLPKERYYQVRRDHLVYIDFIIFVIKRLEQKEKEKELKQANSTSTTSSTSTTPNSTSPTTVSPNSTSPNSLSPTLKSIKKEKKEKSEERLKYHEYLFILLKCMGRNKEFQIKYSGELLVAVFENQMFTKLKINKLELFKPIVLVLLENGVFDLMKFKSFLSKSVKTKLSFKFATLLYKLDIYKSVPLIKEFKNGMSINNTTLDVPSFLYELCKYILEMKPKRINSTFISIFKIENQVDINSKDLLLNLYNNIYDLNPKIVSQLPIEDLFYNIQYQPIKYKFIESKLLKPLITYSSIKTINNYIFPYYQSYCNNSIIYNLKINNYKINNIYYNHLIQQNNQNNQIEPLSSPSSEILNNSNNINNNNNSNNSNNINNHNNSNNTFKYFPKYLIQYLFSFIIKNQNDLYLIAKVCKDFFNILINTPASLNYYTVDLGIYFQYYFVLNNYKQSNFKLLNINSIQHLKFTQPKYYSQNILVIISQMKSLKILEITNPSLGILNDLKLLFKMSNLSKIILNVPYEEFKYFYESYHGVIQLFKQNSSITLEFNLKQFNYENNIGNNGGGSGNNSIQLSSSSDSISSFGSNSSIGSHHSSNSGNRMNLKSINLNLISTDYVIFLHNSLLRNEEIADCRNFILTFDNGDQSYLESVINSPKFQNCPRTIFTQIKSIKLILTLQDCSEFNSILGLFSAIATPNLEFLDFYIDLYYVSHNPIHNIQKIFETISLDKNFASIKSIYIEFGRILFTDYENINFYSFTPDITLNYKKFIRIKEYNSNSIYIYNKNNSNNNNHNRHHICNLDHSHHNHNHSHNHNNNNNNNNNNHSHSHSHSHSLDNNNFDISLKRRKYLNTIS